MSDASKDIDDAAEPFMEQAREALGDVTGDEDTRNAAHPPEPHGERDGNHLQASQRSQVDRD